MIVLLISWAYRSSRVVWVWRVCRSPESILQTEIYHRHEFWICIKTRGGIFGKIWPEPKGFAEGAARRKSWGLRPYFTVYHDLSPSNTDNIPFLRIYWDFVFFEFKDFEFTFCLALCVSYINAFVFNCNWDTKNFVLV